MSSQPSLPPLSWKSADVMSSLKTVREYVEASATSQIEWYYAKKRGKARMSAAMRVLSIVCFTLGGLIPIIKAGLPQTAAATTGFYDFGQLGYLLIGIGAGCIGFDRFFGYSSGWMRYITTAFAIEKSLEEFKFNWAALTANIPDEAPTAEQTQQLIETCKQFSLAVKGQVEQETKAWVEEFQSNLAQLEKELKEKAETAKSESRAQAEAVKPGGISITVTNGAVTDHGFSVELDGEQVDKDVVGNTAELLPVSPGMHRLVVFGTLAGETARASDIVKVAPGDVTKISLQLVAKKAAGAAAGSDTGGAGVNTGANQAG